ncbi:nuclear factor 7, ovary-like [Embiotoca jacksoni]|uniref:nuclear factor 7, ovary-like n=1 Tax=Embiotoca jacksoni TaxID=100190 RepID=UPI003704B26E
MSLTEDPSQETDQKETERREEDELEPEDVPEKDFLKTSQTEKRTISPLTLFKEDFSQFKEDMLKVFKDKDVNPRTGQSAEKLMNPLTLLREDINQLKDDLSSVFRISPSKDRDDKDDSFKIKAAEVEGTEEPFRSLFRRSLLKTPRTEEDVQGATKTPSEKSDGFRGSFSEQKKETVDTEKNNNVKDEAKEAEDGVSEEESETKSFSETPQSDEMTCESPTADLRCESDEESSDSEDDEASETLRWPSLSSGITLFGVRDDVSDGTGGDLWSLKNSACYLTLDPNTANSELRLTEGNRGATRVWSDLRTSDHPERFERCPQVLCREGLLDAAYWEVVWSGGADVGVTYNNISRDGDAPSCLLGHGERSWSLECSEGGYTPCHDGRRFKSSSPEPFSRRVGVHLDWSVGSLSFFCVSPDAMVHLHTFSSAFSEPLYPGFWLWAYDSSVQLRQVELDWERLLQ